MGNSDKITRVLRFNRKPFTRVSRKARWEDGNFLLWSDQFVTKTSTYLAMQYVQGIRNLMLKDVSGVGN